MLALVRGEGNAVSDHIPADSALQLTAESVDFELESRLARTCRHVLRTDGKQLRPNILREAAKYGPRTDDETVQNAAAAVELLHLASVTHDDVIDASDLRRGIETARARFGDRASVLGGGWLFARAVELLADGGDEATRHFCDATARICEGQMLESEDLFNVDRSPQRYLAAIDGKTATLFALSARLGAHLSGADRETVAKLAHYGRDLGLAFQISDDVLDLIAEDLITGKPQGSDLRRGVYTLPLLYALRANPGLAKLLQEPDASSEGLGQLVKEISAAGGFEQALADCSRYVDSAKAAVRGSSHGDLGGIADAVLDRCRGKTG